MGAGARATGVPRWCIVRRRTGGSALSGRVTFRAPETGFCRLRRRLFCRAATVFTGGGGVDGQDLQRVHLRSGGDTDCYAVARGAGESSRGLSGLCPPDARLSALAWFCRTLRQWLPADPSAGRAAAHDWCRCLARLGFGVLPGAWLGRFRSDQQPAAGCRTHHPGLGAGFCRCVTPARGDSRRRQP